MSVEGLSNAGRGEAVPSYDIDIAGGVAELAISSREWGYSYGG